MGRRVTVTLAILVATLFLSADSVWACKFLDNLFGCCRASRCCATYCCEPVCCEPVCCEAVEGAEVSTNADSTAEEPTEAPAEEPIEVPAEEPAEEIPAEEPAEPVVDEPAVLPVEEPPMEEPAEVPVEEPPMDEPAAVPVEEPPVDEPAVPAEEPLEEDPFSRHDTGSMRQWTDASGEYHVEAKFVSFSNGTVRLLKSNGRYCRIELDKLCVPDQTLVQQHVESIATAW